MPVMGRLQVAPGKPWSRTPARSGLHHFSEASLELAHLPTAYLFCVPHLLGSSVSRYPCGVSFRNGYTTVTCCKGLGTRPMPGLPVSSSGADPSNNFPSTIFSQSVWTFVSVANGKNTYGLSTIAVSSRANCASTQSRMLCHATR